MSAVVSRFLSVEEIGVEAEAIDEIAASTSLAGSNDLITFVFANVPTSI